MPLGGLR